MISVPVAGRGPKREYNTSVVITSRTYEAKWHLKGITISGKQNHAQRYLKQCAYSTGQPKVTSI